MFFAMTDTEKVEEKIALRLQMIKDPTNRKKVAREINSLAQTLVGVYKEKKNGKQ